MKTPEELNTIKEEVETVNRKLRDLTEDELAQITGGTDYPAVQWKDAFLYILNNS